jgi:thiol-disulfide isomerase/thioredoxin
MMLRTASRKSLKLTASAALLALFAAACQPGEQAKTPAAATSQAASASPEPAGSPVAVKRPTELTPLKVGSLAKLDLDTELAASTHVFLDKDAKAKTFADFKGKVVVFNMWYETCGPCVKEMPTLARLQEAHPEIAVIAVAFDTEKGGPKPSEDKLKKLSGGKLDFYYDPTWKLAMDANSAAFPTTIIYNKEGQEVARLLADTEWDTPEVSAFLAAVASGKS